ncbi:MAG TPA: hypothetical protein DEB40_11545, partial [Elusimicrobia bacterium]|nr:hypothetical protein [Elusimicrobiota bacterium]
MMLGRHSAAGKTFIIAFFLALWIGEGSLLSASAMRLPQSPFKAEKKLGRWLKREPSVREKISRIIAQNPAAGSYAFPAALAEMGLKDALADIPAVEERRTGASRPRPMGCANFSECRLPPLELDTVSGEPLEPAIQAMLRPWLWLAEAVGRRLVLTP